MTELPNSSQRIEQIQEPIVRSYARVIQQAIGNIQQSMGNEEEAISDFILPEFFLNIGTAVLAELANPISRRLITHDIEGIDFDELKQHVATSGLYRVLPLSMPDIAKALVDENYAGEVIEIMKQRAESVNRFRKTQ